MVEDGQVCNPPAREIFNPLVVEKAVSSHSFLVRGTVWQTLTDEIEFTEGMEIERGFISPYFVKNQEAVGPLFVPQPWPRPLSDHRSPQLVLPCPHFVHGHSRP